MAAALAGPAGPQTGVWKTGPRRSALTTGIPLVFHQDKASAMTVVGLFVPGGRAAVPAGLDGLAYLTTRLTLEIPDEGKARDLMAQATRMTFSCEEDFSLVVIECLSENLEAALRVAGKIIQDPLMTGLRIGRGKEMMALYAQAEEDDAVLTGSNAALKAFFRGQGYGSASYGSEASLKAIERTDVLAFFRRHFTSKSVFFGRLGPRSGAGPGPAREALFQVPGGERPEVAAAPRPPEDREVRSAKDSSKPMSGAPMPCPRRSRTITPGLSRRGLDPERARSRLWALRTAERLAYNVDSG
jgi:predicted Zn-dependent peptidase